MDAKDQGQTPQPAQQPTQPQAAQSQAEPAKPADPKANVEIVCHKYADDRLPERYDRNRE